MATIKALEKNAEYIGRFLAHSCDQKARAKVLRAQVALMQKQSAADKEAAAVPPQKTARVQAVPRPSSAWDHLDNADEDDVADPLLPNNEDLINIEDDEIDQC